MPQLMPGPAADAAFAELLQAQQARLMALLRRLSPHDADDLLQEALARAWRYRQRCDLQHNPAGWLLQTAFRTFLDHRQRQRHIVAADDASVQAAGRQPPCAAELRDELERSLRPLLPIERALLLGFHKEQLSLQQLAQRHALPLNTVKSHLHRARQRLQHRDAESRP